jgi:peptide/nickel transport system ATP-binding protein
VQRRERKLKLSVEGLRAHYITGRGPVRAVDGVNFELGEGEVIGIVGESACGKSTLGSALMRSLQPPGKILGGKVVLEGRDVLALSQREFDKSVRWKKVAMVFQGAMNALDPVYTVASQLKEVLHVHGFDSTKGEIDARVSEALTQVGLDPSAVGGRYPHELSGGMKQRVVIAMALLLEPGLLIADEPTTALDVLVQSQIIALLDKLRREKGVSIVLITHDLALVLQLADRVGIMYAGQLVEVGAAESIYKNPRHPYTQALIAAMPRLHSGDKRARSIPGSPPSLLDPPAGCRFFARCPHAMDACRADPPEFPTETGYVRCWLASLETDPTQP